MMSAKKYEKNVCVSLREGKYEPQKLKHLSNKLFLLDNENCLVLL